ncbi:MAG: hypothetical protein EOP55_24845, partial [Sphingobacteriales bacterium]
MFKFYTKNRCKPPGYAKNLLRAIHIAAFILLANSPKLKAQTDPNQLNVQGIVYDEQEKVLAGASVKIQGSDKSVTTDNDGIFRLNGVKPNAILIVSYIGYGN